jgi:hypothetical protein
MPSPFPGMDPYLEHPSYWPSLQQYFCTRLADVLRDVLPRRYLAQVKERVFREEQAALFPPAATNHERPLPPRPTPPDGRLDQHHSPAWFIPTAPEDIRETFVEIVVPGEPHQVVSVIELLGPANKTPETTSRCTYRRQQKSLLAGAVHLLEIDVLRAGLPTVAAPFERIVRRGRFHYLVSLSRAGGREFCEVWPIALRDSLPRVVLPLAAGDSDLTLDLQTVFTYCYEAGSFARRIDYHDEPFYPLSCTDAAWAEKVVLQWEMRG